MKILKCTNCGSIELADHGSYAICDYCRSRFAYTKEQVSSTTPTIGVASDIDALLKKCQDDPINRRRYASLVLDLDPTNQQAHQFLL